MNCASQLAGILWNIDAYVLWSFIGVAITIFSVWGLTVLYYRVRYVNQINAQNLYDTGLHGEPEPNPVVRWFRRVRA